MFALSVNEQPAVCRSHVVTPAETDRSFLPISTPFVVLVGLSHPFWASGFSLSGCICLPLVAIAFTVGFQVNYQWFYMHTYFYAWIVVIPWRQINEPCLATALPNHFVSLFSSDKVISYVVTQKRRTWRYRTLFGDEHADVINAAPFRCQGLANILSVTFMTSCEAGTFSTYPSLCFHSVQSTASAFEILS
jgi:hypothetical protein